MAQIGVVKPTCKAEGCLEELYRRLKTARGTVMDDFEILLIEDGGGDRSWPMIVDLAGRDPRVSPRRVSWLSLVKKLAIGR